MNGQRIREVREMRGWTQEELSEIAKVNVQQINRYENNKNQPNADILKRLAAALRVSADYLLGLTSDPTPRLIADELSLKERTAVDAWRHGKRIEAIKVIVDDE